MASTADDADSDSYSVTDSDSDTDTDSDSDTGSDTDSSVGERVCGECHRATDAIACIECAYCDSVVGGCCGYWGCQCCGALFCEGCFVTDGGCVYCRDDEVVEDHRAESVWTLLAWGLPETTCRAVISYASEHSA